MRSQEPNKPILFNYPIHHLNGDEIAEPLLVIKDFFSFAHLPEVREMLWLSFKTNVTGAFPQGEVLTANERSYIVILYEQILRLVEAAHLVNEQSRSISTNK